MILGCTSLRGLAEETTRILEDLTGYDRVMARRLDTDGRGEVFVEPCEPKREFYLGNRYPASDIPQIAGRPHECNHIRVLLEVNARQVPIEPHLWPLTGRDLDISAQHLTDRYLVPREH